VAEGSPPCVAIVAKGTHIQAAQVTTARPVGGTRRTRGSRWLPRAHERTDSRRLTTSPDSKRAQEVDDSLLIGLTQVVEVADDGVGLGPGSGVGRDRDGEVTGATVVEEEQALTDPP